MKNPAGVADSRTPPLHGTVSEMAPSALTSFYPVLCTRKLSESAAFYKNLFGFETTFENEWYVSLRRTEPPHQELALVDAGHPSVPEGFRQPVQGVLLNFEVADVDARPVPVDYADCRLRQGGAKPGCHGPVTDCPQTSEAGPGSTGSDRPASGLCRLSGARDRTRADGSGRPRAPAITATAAATRAAHPLPTRSSTTTAQATPAASRTGPASRRTAAAMHPR